jgi:hypothetical protein
MCSSGTTASIASRFRVGTSPPWVRLEGFLSGGDARDASTQELGDCIARLQRDRRCRCAWLDGALCRPLSDRAEDQRTGEQGVNDPVACSLRSPDLRVVGSFTPCASASGAGARVVAGIPEKRAPVWPATDETAGQPGGHHAGHSHARPRRRARLSATLRPRVSARLAREHATSGWWARGLDNAAAERGPRQLSDGAQSRPTRL